MLIGLRLRSINVVRKGIAEVYCPILPNFGQFSSFFFCFFFIVIIIIIRNLLVALELFPTWRVLREIQRVISAGARSSAKVFRRSILLLAIRFKSCYN